MAATGKVGASFWPWMIRWLFFSVRREE